MKKKWKISLFIILIISIISIISWIYYWGGYSEKSPYLTMEEAKAILQRKNYDIVETESMDLLDGTTAAGQFIMATKKDDFALVFKLDDISQGEEVYDTVKKVYEYNTLLSQNDMCYVMTTQATKDLGREPLFPPITIEPIIPPITIEPITTN